MHRFIIIGGGAGGLELATRLGDRYGARGRREARAHVTLVDRHPTHIWKPLLHEVAAGSMDPFTQELEYAAQARWHGFEFQQGELISIDRGARRVLVAAVHDGDGLELMPERELEYDTLVIAIGSTTHFFGVEGAQQHAIALDTVSEAERFRKRLIAACIRAEHRVPEPAQPGVEPDRPQAAQPAEPAEPRVQVVIVGAGATGVELSAELRNTAQVLAAYGLHKLDPQRDVGIVLIESGPRILPALPERVANATAELLGKLGVRLMTGERVTEVAPGCVRTASGQSVRADLTVWAAGIKAPALLSQLDGLEVNRLGQLVVRQTLQTTLDDDVFALGDCAACAWPGNDRGVPPRAQAAHQQASFLLRALACRLERRPLPSFTYRDFGSLVSLGHFSAVGSLMGGLIGGNMLIEGLFARFMYMSLYRLHIAALHGYPRMMLDTVAHWLRRSTLPRVKLH
ncbi:NAD(P)/FAD-dependent oxidoreductase [Burkholderia glumae]|uniref:NAD(P)/FAD-dependent oxidoreductase n=1 Tax=Burkholderia glumae TaxID=337 RepID=A0AAP9XW24_BURGL|nr:NAD(P)/FAD-dependent oxidoreductase [Burkholderia glumae]AJY63160.1 FAD dependent oxidoreductase family protein [Burkholderia glumae LMG 2196 = ATCC 33617]KHJ60157.1 pyridine nucleotide-disulfide oxidoreductase [Burkholderia glumae]MCM2484881.1 NAD(P)/FAD-dependent oxidoreductase [Burkholderia glumae]MCM2493244.1 NAD(P)/FAD-dependent oxidoreductase [Burkholderia glumae]MCM2510574.1 NAD(P)/FAD-dependent oxidoreductase [Burkholderia glumae]